MSDAIERLWYPQAPERWTRRTWMAPLSLASAGFRAGVALRDALYRMGMVKPRRVSGLQVISVGNLNVGGAGKTPAVIYLARMLTKSGRRVAVLSRGYGRSSKRTLVFDDSLALPAVVDAGDEPLLIARSCPGVTVLVGADRVDLAEQARDRGMDVAILDDGMQHRRLARDVELVVVDEAAGFGNGQLMPRGPLREPLSALSRADLIWLRSAAQPNPSLVLPAGIPVVRTRYAPRDLKAPDGLFPALDALANRPVLALAGLARPGGFVRTLEQLGANVVQRRFFPDHHPFQPKELDEVLEAAKLGNLTIATTEKDAMRLPSGFPAYVVRLDVEVESGGEALAKAVGVPRDNAQLGGRSLGIHDPSQIDVVSAHPRTGEFCLVMLDTPEWRRAPDRVQQLQAKVQNYIHFALGGQLARLYPDSVGKPVRLQLNLNAEPEGELARVLDQLRAETGRKGVPFVVRVVPGRQS